MKDDNSTLYPVKHWRHLSLPPNAWGVDTARLLQVCGQVLQLRATVTDQGQQVIEVFCATDDEHAQAEALFCQAAADEVLRREINDRCNQVIGTLVDSVLIRVTGQ